MPALHELGPHYALAAIGFSARKGYLIALAIETDDEHGSSVALADGLVGGEYGRFSALGRCVADALAETAVAELIGATKEFDGIIGAVGSQSGLHGAEMLIAKGQDVRPHAKRVYHPESLNH